MDPKTIKGEVGSLAAHRKGSGPASWAESSWHEADVKKYPASISDFTLTHENISKFCLQGHTPSLPFLGKEDNVIAIGSCFAAELRHFLNDVGLSSDSFWIPSGLNNTFSLLDFFSWVTTGHQTSKGFGYSKDDSGTLGDWEPKFERSSYRKALENANCFVFTLGLAEVWEDTLTSKVFWRGVPANIFDEKRHHFRLSTVEENVTNIVAITEFIRKLNPKAPIIFTLSPVPLKATFSEVPCISADCVSKSTLRLALHQVISQKLTDVYYWPSFEIVKWVGCHLPFPVYGTDDSVVRHVSRYVVTKILYSFVATYYGENLAKEIFDNHLMSLPSREGLAGEPPLIYTGQIVTA
ncbi:GSCFA domain-containing protein [Paraglaciecola chathamensis]|uniref:GSCFA domain-containing protein n=1 Tax=Paraglaciecola chathamensis TaxID=368405 RepID=UPI0027018921|nr:GSCFA domain-containing protein [Paraglaciecola chathamensis]MDO6838028.1 GSCFA domain-containing protein [Paraglaciecola chathamensis]